MNRQLLSFCVFLNRTYCEIQKLRRHTMNKLISKSCLVLLGLLSTSFASGQDPIGSKDHPLFSRYKNMQISNYKIKAFDRYERNPVYCDPSPCKTSVVKDFSFSAEGKITEIQYVSPGFEKVSLLEVLRNYENAVKQLGGQRLTVNTLAEADHVFAMPSKRDDPKSPPIYLHLNLTAGSDGYQLAVIEPAQMEQTVTAGQLGQELKAKGFITLYINFATAKSDLPDDAKSVVSELAKLLETNPKLKLSVEGHTDNVGNANDNLTLSNRRSQSIVTALVALGVNKTRLLAAGKGQSTPVADNRTEEGRAKNRRVELVEVKS
jgi:OmpA-OmpF porin, OOP family